MGLRPAAMIQARRSSLACWIAVSRARWARASANRCGPAGIRPTTPSIAKSRITSERPLDVRARVGHS